MFIPKTLSILLHRFFFVSQPSYGVTNEINYTVLFLYRGFLTIGEIKHLLSDRISSKRFGKAMDDKNNKNGLCNLGHEI